VQSVVKLYPFFSATIRIHQRNQRFKKVNVVALPEPACRPTDRLQVYQPFVIALNLQVLTHSPHLRQAA
jgi:hypothetical protein